MTDQSLLELLAETGEVRLADLAPHNPHGIAKSTSKRWIAGAIKKPGAFRKDVKRKYGEEGFDRKGRIKLKVIKEMSDDPGVVGKRARLAHTLRRITTRTARRRRESGRT